ncbi:MAG: hypothetical protein EPO10_07260 [Reyranella sp.]|uniref:hypothetical protein n=1 Tax=Reyranella sp. TaxID=1929291 RepID=UPI001200ED6B|nr:hypothetical protein [Reyranella sp.]TAJ92124.1 MAG: hypothetical protein EPO41_14540 [Reyranella sp.]TBR29569.1 MAG: hypothetical protein EPO10_07260 [Reyranella sp.]
MADDMSPMDRDCIVAAILTTGMKDDDDVTVEERTVVERFIRILREIRDDGGTAELWQKGANAAQRKLQRRERRKAAATD